MPHVVIANRLRDGIVVFLGTDHRWVERIQDCTPADDADAGEKLLDLGRQAEAEQEIVDPNLIEVEVRDGVATPIKMREAIRAKGPTVRTDLGKQAEN